MSIARLTPKVRNQSGDHLLGERPGAVGRANHLNQIFKHGRGTQQASRSLGWNPIEVQVVYQQAIEIGNVVVEKHAQDLPDTLDAFVAFLLEREDLLLRARLDFDQGRTRTAALQANLALATLENELGESGTEATRDAARAYGEPLARLAAAALERELAEDEIPKLREALLELERLVRRRRHAAE